MPQKIESLAKTLLKNPVEVKLAVSKPAEKIKQSCYMCYETQKLAIIKDIFKEEGLKRVIIFCGSKMKVKQVAGALQRKNVNCGEMHSDLDQAQRDEMMFRFKSGQIDVLVATDILSRGIDIDDITMVINYDVPHDAEDYVHRIGRTARADKDGRAITLVSKEDRIYFSQIEKFLEKKIDRNALPDGLTVEEEPRSTAKSRRRKDRDQQSHRRKPHRSAEGQQPREGEQGQQGGEQQPKGGRNENRRQRQPRQKEGQQHRDENQPKQQRREEGQKQQRRQNQQGGQKQRQNGGQRNDRNRRQQQKPQQQKPATQQPKAPQKKEGGLKALVKKSLSWISHLGRK